jgi:hypothetical protein
LKWLSVYFDFSQSFFEELDLVETTLDKYVFTLAKSGAKTFAKMPATAAVSVLALAFMGDAAQKEPIQFFKGKTRQVQPQSLSQAFFPLFLKQILPIQRSFKDEV